ncbi:potassium channel family protein [Desulfurococcus mucosus]|uniref:TrkA-N domain protein n=1 Tax=Desulfurococcus mucosus (strain ATCC 35584 / DSM 2162 / JCM 9187 / O7/1) TaxID=765177 RepID=E8RA91_DESM0|nr:NAD-binding protein [Desulfurococcus mucosus]ADV65397.1 TrkA-N domain protein [Desulfurococcus mucosus DSM 2162]
MARPRILVIGGGKVAEHLFTIFNVHEEADEVVVVDKDPRRRAVFERIGDILVLDGDATDVGLYNEINMKEITAVLALTNSDEVNLMVLAIAKTFGVPVRIGRFTEPKIAELVSSLGLGIPIVQPVVVANIIAQILTSISSGKVLGEIGEEKIVMAAISDADPVVGNTIGEISLGDEGKIILLFDGLRFKVPEPSDVVKPGNILIILARSEEVLRKLKG